MNYRLDRYGNKISLLGFGCMRLPQTAGIINKAEAEKQIMAAYNAGVNYFDTANIYPGSESAIGEIFEKNGIRKNINIATKLPHYLIKTRDGLDKLFNEELKRLRTDYIDYYLMHMLTDLQSWEKLKAIGILDWIAEKKANGQIRQIGFSYHGNSDMYCKLLDAYDWDFTLIQYNYMDENTQAGRKGLEYSASKGLPVFIMEPLRGGKLVNKLPQEALDIFAGYSKQHTPAQWAFRWLFNQQAVTCVLSGMNSMEMVQDNINTASTTAVGDLTDEDNDMLQQVAGAINAKMKVGCTACGYCMPCPVGVDIPGTFAAYNRRYTESKFWGFIDYTMCTALRKDPSSASKCIGCGKCERHCPQSIEIRKELKNATDVLETPIYKFVVKGIEKLKLFG
ncbi:MAG: aldo/keto reductase [Oscillospiraceae bacterium]|nr:aldo/keto reductase [Oscillospiraceae bacterium]